MRRSREEKRDREVEEARRRVAGMDAVDRQAGRVPPAEDSLVMLITTIVCALDYAVSALGEASRATRGREVAADAYVMLEDLARRTPSSMLLVVKSTVHAALGLPPGHLKDVVVMLAAARSNLDTLRRRTVGLGGLG